MRALGGPQSRSWRCGIGKRSLLALPGIETQSSSPWPVAISRYIEMSDLYRIYDKYSKNSLHINISERTRKCTLTCHHFVLFVAHVTCFDPCFGSSSDA
jgi:hypothetical protein